MSSLELLKLQTVAQKLVRTGKGILAADESEQTITKKFARFGIVATSETIGAWRELLFTTPKIEQWISGVILHESTVGQLIDGVSVPEYLAKRGILSGVKVDQGLSEYGDLEKITQGIERLDSILPEYKTLGCVFAKWRAVFRITDVLPTRECIQANAFLLAQYAKTCQEHGMVPIVEPEVLMDGDHTIDRCAEVTTEVLTVVFAKLKEAGVDLSGMLLKPNMVVAGKLSVVSGQLSEGTMQEDMHIAEMTLAVLGKTVPQVVPGIVFLSGGQSPDEATRRLGMIVKRVGSLASSRFPWQLSFSFGRALEDEACAAWGGKEENRQKAQEVFARRAQQVAGSR